MADTPETKVKKKVRATLKAMGAFAVPYVATGFTSSGVPDILCCYAGRFFGIECKTAGKKPTRLQESTMQEICTAGGMCYVIDETNLHQLEGWMVELASRGEVK